MNEDQVANNMNVEIPVQGSAEPTPAGPAALAPEELAALREQAAQASAHWERFVRLNADFDNFKKRAAKDRLDAIKYANEALIEKLLPVVDNFEAALVAGAGAEAAAANPLVMGVKMIATQLRGVLAESGLEEIEALGKAFDPTIHEALSQLPSTTAPEGQVLQVVRKGYRLKERMLRPAAVIVAGKLAADGARQE